MSEREAQQNVLNEAARVLAGESPETILRWALQRYSPRIVLACSFGGPSGMVLLDIVMKLDRTTPVYYLDTGLLFPQTYDLVERVSARYKIVPRPIRTALSVEGQNAQYGKALWSRDPDACCNLRKVEPQRAFLADYEAWITGLRREQSAPRAQTAVVGWDPQFELAKIAPLASWDDRSVWEYVRVHDVPCNELNLIGYPSVGCLPCTRAVAPDEDARAGRWAGFDKLECGLHVAPVQQ